MHYINFLQSIVQLINTETPERIQKKITNAEKKQTVADLDHLKIAHDFLKLHHPLSEGWDKSVDCFKMLADFFINQNNISDNFQKAITCWFFLLENHMPKTLPNQIIFSLGRIYLQEPYQYAGLICWLIEDNLPNDALILNSKWDHRIGWFREAILDSELMHQFFHLNVFDLEKNVIHTYEQIKRFSNKTARFLDTLNTIPCRLRGMTADKTQPPFFQSYNVLGTRFEHTNPISIQRFNTERTYFNFESVTQDTILAHAVPLFHLFHLELLKISYDPQFLKSLITALLSDPSTVLTVLSALPHEILNESLPNDKNTAELVLKIVCDLYMERANPDNKIPGCLPPLVPLLVQNPFYLHALPLLRFLSGNEITTTVHSLTTQHHYNRSGHIPYLCILGNELFKRGLQNESDRIFEMVFSLFTKATDITLDKYHLDLQSVKTHLAPRYNENIQRFLNELERTITQSIKEEKTYDDVESCWSSQLGLVNIFNLLFAKEIENIHYPRNKYQLHSLYLLRHFERNPAFSIETILDTLSESDEAFKIRILRECISLLENTALINTLILYAKNHFEDDLFHTIFFEPFGQGSFLYKNIIQKSRAELIQTLLVSTLTLPQDFKELLAEIVHINHSLLIALFQSNFNESLSTILIQEMINAFGISSLLKKCLLAMNPTFFSQALINFIIKNRPETTSIKKTLNCIFQNYDYDFFKDFLFKTGVFLSENNFFDGLRYLCRIDHIPAINRSFPECNFDLYCQVLEHYKQNPLIDPLTKKNNLADEFKTRCGYDSSLLHLAAQQEHFNCFSRLVNIFKSIVSPGTFASILNHGEIHCPVIYPDAVLINNLIVKLKKEFPPEYKRERESPTFFEEDRRRKKHRSESRPSAFPDFSDDDFLISTLLDSHMPSETSSPDPESNDFRI